MNSKYSDLHIERWKNRASVAVAGAAVLALAENASAAPLSLASPQTISAGGANWKVSNSTSAFSGQGLGISEASLVGPPVRHDAFDGAFNIKVNGTAFQDPTGTVDLTGTTLTSNSVVMSGLNVTEQYFFDPASPTVRVVVSLQNPTGAPITATVTWDNNLGSDSATAIVTTSSGDTLVTSADQWFISWDGTPTGDPTQSPVAFGPGASVTPTTLFAPGQTSATPDRFDEQYVVTVPAGATRRLMFFDRLYQDNATAQSQISTFATITSLQNAGLLAGLSGQQQSEIVNWSGTQLPGTPIMGTFSLLVTALLLGAVAIKARSWMAGFRQA